MTAPAPQLPAEGEGSTEGGEVIPIGAGGAPVASDLDGWTALETMRRRIDDQGTVVRKTQSQVGELASSIAALVEGQRKKARQINLSSFVAYLLFTVLLAGGFYALYSNRATSFTEAAQHASSERAEAQKRADEANAKLAAHAAAEAGAWEVYQLLEAGKRDEAKAKLAALKDAPLTKTERAVLAATAHETEVKAADAQLKAAVAAFKAGHYADVIGPLEAALATEPNGPHATTMRYYLGVAYAKTGPLAKSISYLGEAVAQDVDQEDARFQLASVLDREGQYPRARAEYDKYATAHPQSQNAVFAMRRSATLARLPAVVPPPAVPPAAPKQPAPVVAPPPKQHPAPTPPPATPPAAPTTPDDNPAPTP